MLELRPSCENCGAPLPPAATDARICSFECTLGAACVDGVLGNVCRNCGGGFVQRPIRPVTNWNDDNHLAKYPAATRVRHCPIDRAAHARLAATIREIPPEMR